MVDVYKEVCTRWWMGICTSSLYEMVDGRMYKEIVRDGGIGVICEMCGYSGS